MAKPEAELYRDKVELHLEGQQVFMLFFGGAILATLIFVLGVSIGRRVESQSLENMASTAVSPLDALDRLEMGEELSFSTILRNEPKKKSSDHVEAKKNDAAVAVVEKEEAQKAEKESPKEKIPEAKEKTAAKAQVHKPATQKTQEKATEQNEEKQETKPVESRFTLQVGSFQNEKEAKNFEAELKKDGYKAFTKTIKLGDKGTWYRVRFGNYQDYDKALADKANFEKAKNIIAYVTRVRK